MNVLKHCYLCENEITNLKKGLTCKLTHKKPSFYKSCVSITLDKKFQKIVETANLELKIIQRNQKSTYHTFYFTIIIGYVLIIGGYFFSQWTIQSLFLWYVKLAIIGTGVVFLTIAYSKLKDFRRKKNKKELHKTNLDNLLKIYGIEFTPSFVFEENIHGIQEVLVKLQFKNWAKKQTATAYKING